jgi:hypothetical protein
MRVLIATSLLLMASLASLANAPLPDEPASPPAPAKQTAADADRKSVGCMSCHTASDRHTMHANPAVVLGCTDCHGGNVAVEKPAGAEYKGKDAAAYVAAMGEAHVKPRFPRDWKTPASANPEGSYTLLNRESPAFVRFVNPSDYRVARESCGACHLPVIQAAERSLMSTGAMLWNGASYNNGILPFKRGILGESYTSKGEPATIMNPVKPDEWLTQKGVLAQLFPLPAWETIPPGDVFRVFERGGRVISSQFPEVAIPNSSGKLQTMDEPGRPDIKQSNRGPGTGGRISVPVINITKTRLNDPVMWFLGTNDQPGDYRSSGCAGCHVVYANDRDPLRSGVYAQYGNDGKTITADPTIPKDKSGHPLKHEFTRSIPSSQCMICHMHQPNIFVNSFYGFTMWDYESDAPSMWPDRQRYPTAEERRRILDRNPGRRRGAREMGRSGVPERRLQAQSDAQGHPVCRLSRPRLEFPRDLQTRSQGHAAGQGRQPRLRRPIRQVQSGKSEKSRASDVHTSRIRDAMRRLPFCAGCPWQRAYLRRGRRCHRNRMRGLSRNFGPLPDAFYLRPGGQARRDRHEPDAYPRRQEALRVEGGQAVPALGHVSRPGVGDVAGQGFGQSCASALQRKGRARQADIHGRYDNPALGIGTCRPTSARTAKTR